MDNDVVMMVRMVYFKGFPIPNKVKQLFLDTYNVLGLISCHAPSPSLPFEFPVCPRYSGCSRDKGHVEARCRSCHQESKSQVYIFCDCCRATISDQEFDMIQEFEILDSLSQY
jgi:hypothetical protein